MLDIGLPDIDGFEVLKAFRRRGSQTPVLMLTAKGDESDVVLGLGIGADDYMVKPYSPNEMIARVRAVVNIVTEIEKFSATV